MPSVACLMNRCSATYTIQLAAPLSDYMPKIFGARRVLIANMNRVIM